jgi:hypothetical protein
MAHNFKLATLSVNAAADAVTARLNGGAVRLYDGLQPATADSAILGPVLLAELVLDTPAFANAIGGVATANPISDEDSALATGTATWFRAVTAGGQAVFDGSVGVSNADLVLGSVSISMGAIVTIDSFTYTQPKT